LVQGIAIGGEWGGAVLIATEHSPIDSAWHSVVLRLGKGAWVGKKAC
jgi:hypothetical protein